MQKLVGRSICFRNNRENQLILFQGNRKTYYQRSMYRKTFFIFFCGNAKDAGTIDNLTQLLRRGRCKLYRYMHLILLFRACGSEILPLYSLCMIQRYVHASVLPRSICASFVWILYGLALHLPSSMVLNVCCTCYVEASFVRRHVRHL